MVCVLKFMRIDVLAEALLLCCCCCCCVPYIAVLLVQLLLAVVATGVLVVGGQVAGSTGGPVQLTPRRTVPVKVRVHLVPHVTRFNHSVRTPSPLSPPPSTCSEDR
jgi:hypothetical protein